jgi:branched-chain amino acid aminotransferase
MVPPLPDLGQAARLAIVDRLRNDRRALDPATKSGNYLNSVLGLAEAKELGATDCVMLNADGFVTEASTANVFARIDGSWCTPPSRLAFSSGSRAGYSSIFCVGPGRTLLSAT